MGSYTAQMRASVNDKLISKTAVHVSRSCLVRRTESVKRMFESVPIVAIPQLITVRDITSADVIPWLSKAPFFADDVELASCASTGILIVHARLLAWIELCPSGTWKKCAETLKKNQLYIFTRINVP